MNIELRNKLPLSEGSHFRYINFVFISIKKDCECPKIADIKTRLRNHSLYCDGMCMNIRPYTCISP